MRYLDVNRLNELYTRLEQQALDDFRREGFAEAPRLVRSVDLRYVGQNWELSVALPGGELTGADFEKAADLFASEHERFYGYSIPGEELELLAVNVAAVGSRHEIELPKIGTGSGPDPIDRRGAVFDANEGRIETAVYRRDDFTAGATIDGPAIVGQNDATTLIPPGSTARVDEYGNLLITV